MVGIEQDALPKRRGDEALGMIAAHQRSRAEAIASFFPTPCIQRAGGRQERVLHGFYRCRGVGEIHGLKKIDLRFEREAMIGL